VHIDGCQIQIVEVVVVVMRIFALLQHHLVRMTTMSMRMMMLRLHQRLSVVMMMGSRRLEGIIPLPVPFLRLLLGARIGQRS